MNDLKTYFDNNKDRIIIKWSHYFDVYERFFGRFKNKEIVILEIGVSQGGSLQMWKSYFGPQALIYGIDIDPRCKEFEEANIRIFIGSQSDKKFLNDVISRMPPIDILIDDGGHTMFQQIVSFENLFKHIKDDGIYLCEDCHTSYMWDYGGGYKRFGTFIEYTKKWIDYINAFHSETNRLKPNVFTKSIKSLHYYDSIVVIEKGNVEKPFPVKSGLIGFKSEEAPQMLHYRIMNRLKLIWRRLSAFLRLPYHVS